MPDALPEPEELTPEWLTTALRRTGAVSERATVREVRATPVGGGLSARSFRIALTWDGDAGEAPQTLVGKFASGEARGLATARATGTYQRELRFYREIAPTCGVRSPLAFVAEFERETGRFVLLLEDLSASSPGDQLAGCSVAEAELAIAEAAKLHASHWDDAGIDELRYLIRHTAGGWVSITLGKVWPDFLEAFGERLPDGGTEVGARLAQHFDAYLDAIDSPRCIVHYDYRLDNMLFGTGGDTPPVAVLDWQTVGQAPGVADVAYFLGTSFDDARSEHELPLLGSYHDALVAAGVEGYDFVRCQDDYRRLSLLAAGLTVVACMAIPATDERGLAMFSAMVERQFRQVLDLDAQEFLVT